MRTPSWAPLRRAVTAAIAVASFALVAGAGCGSSAAPGDVPPDVPDVPPLDVLPDVPDVLDDAPADLPDVPLTCESLLKDWQCLGPGTCADWQECSGPQSCDAPPCWGDYCDDVPGTCLPRVDRTPTFCWTSDDCPADAGLACVGAEGTGADGFPGACVGRPPVAGACWGDADCPPGQRCAGETTCPRDRLGPCADLPGLCAPTLASGQCLDDGDCGAGKWCQGAILCALGATECSDQAGTCATGGRAGCSDNQQCAADPDGPFCVGSGPGRAGFCSPAFGLHQGDCWEDAACGQDTACLGATPCPPGHRCRAGGFHAGYCGPFPPASTGGVQVLFVDDKAATPRGRALVHNGLPVPIVFPACYALLHQTDKDGQWPEDQFTGEMHDRLCTDPATNSAVRVHVPAGGTRVLTGLTLYGPDIPASKKRLLLTYQMDCDRIATTECRIPARIATSAEYQ